MLSSPIITEREFHPRYSLLWKATIVFNFVTAAAYITSLVRGEYLGGILGILGIGALFAVLSATALTLKRVEFGTKIKLRYVLWPAKVFEYRDILEIRLPEIVLDAHEPINLENIANLEELQQEFKSLELLGVVERGHIREIQPPSSGYSFKPRFWKLVWGTLSAFFLGFVLLSIADKVNFLWLGILLIFFASEVFTKLFGKSEDE
jgi:hypothetical protein